VEEVCGPRMQLAVSNIGWKPEDDVNVAKILINLGISKIELAPSKYSVNFSKFEEVELFTIVDKWERLGIEIYSMQSLLFGLPELELFGDEYSRGKLKKHLLKLASLGGKFGVGPMVFGSPKNRLRKGLKLDVAVVEGAQFFRELVEDWEGDSCFIVFEANPKDYGCDFITSTSEAFEFTKAVGSTKMQNHIDYTCTKLGGEDPIEFAKLYGGLTKHVHLSEHFLQPLDESKIFEYKSFFSNLNISGYGGVISLEMKDPGSLGDLEKSIAVFKEASFGS
jgi:D-psicose/D-tagatose/L-ribulose 3-epimerase